MSEQRADKVLHQLRRWTIAAAAGPEYDRQMLQRFLRGRDEAAFAALVERYGPMVLHLCRRVLGDAHEAEDAFQATFLILARKAATIRQHQSLGGWLYRVAYHVATRARASATRRRDLSARPPHRPTADPLAEVSGRELLQVLDDELQRLPEKYHLPLLLCYLQGQTQDEAARQLGWSPQTLRGRVDRGRALLRRRLIRRGFTLPAALLGALLTQAPTPAAVPPPLISETLHAVASMGQPGVAASAAVAALVRQGLRATSAARLKHALSLVLMLAVLGAGAGWAALQTPREEAPSLHAGDAEGPVVRRKVDVHGDALPADALVRFGSVRLRQGDRVHGLAFSPDGKALASGSNHHDYGDDRAVCLWDVSTGRLLRSFRGKGHSIRYLAFSPDGKTLATAGGDQTLRLWAVATGQEVRRLGGRTGDDLLAFSPDGRRLASTSSRLKGHRITLWDPATGKEVLQLGGGEDTAATLVFAPDSQTLAALGDGPDLVLWDAATGKEVRRLQVGTPSAYWPPVAFTPDGKQVAAVQADHTIHLWSTTSGQEVRSFRGHTDRVIRLAFSADGTTLTSAAWDKTVRTWEVSTGKARRLLRLDMATGCLDCMAFSPAEKMLAAGGYDNTLRLWDLAGGKEVRLASGHQAPVIALAFSSTGKELTSVSWDRTFRHWDARTGRELQRSGGLQATLLSVPILLNPQVPTASLLKYAIGLSPDGRLLATGEGDNNGRIHLWDVARGKEIPFSARHTDSVLSLAFSPQGRVLASGGWDRTVRTWEVATGKALHSLGGHQGGVYSVCFSPDGRRLASASADRTIRVWDADMGKELHCLRHETSLFVVAFSADGRMLAAAGAQHANEKPGYTALVVWEVASGKERYRLLAKERVVAALAFSPDSRSLASASTDGTVHVWEAFSGRKRGDLKGHHGLVRSLAFSPDGHWLASGGSDTSALLWDVARLPAAPPRPVQLHAEEREALWRDLSSSDAGRAYQAMSRLVACPDTAGLLRQHVRPVSSGNGQKIARWIGDLDSDAFAAREQASAGLLKAGDRAERALRDALAGSPSLEARRRIEALLARLSRLTPELLASLRAVEVLEHMGTSQAREVLHDLAAGDPEARLTREAKASLDRLTRQAER